MKRQDSLIDAARHAVTPSAVSRLRFALLHASFGTVAEEVAERVPGDSKAVAFNADGPTCRECNAEVDDFGLCLNEVCEDFGR